MRSLPGARGLLPAARCGALFFSSVSQQVWAHTTIIIPTSPPPNRSSPAHKASTHNAAQPPRSRGLASNIHITITTTPMTKK